MKESVIGYDVIEFTTKALALRFKLRGRDFTHIIGIARGGMVPATIMSYIFDAELLGYNVSSYKGKKRGELKVIQDVDFDSIDKDAKILVIDDICDSGNTIKHIKEVIGNRFSFVRYAALFAKEKSKDVVDHYGVIVQDNNWLVFPWES
jgi:hypoxanthine phosphoribosyltransferase